jgi:hypothetical protein
MATQRGGTTLTLFGSERAQRMLLEMYENGEIRTKAPGALLIGSGLAYRFRRGVVHYAALDECHPEFRLVLSVLAALSGQPRGAQPCEKPQAPSRLAGG